MPLYKLSPLKGIRPMTGEMDDATRLAPDDPRVPMVLDLIQRSFAYMEGRIDPPSSVQRLTPAAIAKQCEVGEVWVIGTPPNACVFLSPKADCLYLGKLAVDTDMQRQGTARRLVELATARAHALGLPALELKTRIELTENHETFESLGFSVISQGCHEGYDRPTNLIMRRPVPWPELITVPHD
jgi:GNAT superfamily N-acetyltransferase